ncbi:MAG: methylmalonyl-CoA mutase, partial [Candidatus Marinimicrobia bacterium]|nr:methylmalonyl-CoA mutase [Candidatus Neomarinimicrobiota bacterium]
IKKIDDLGGALNAIENGFIQNEIARSAYEYQKAVEEGAKLIVGVNAFESEQEIEPETFEINPDVLEKQMEKLELLKKERDSAGVERALSGLSRAAETAENTMPEILNCVKSKATLGEISDAMRKVFGEYKP